MIGYNSDGDFGLGHDSKVSELTELPNKSITKVVAGQDYFIFSNVDHSKLWGAGSGESGQLGIGNDDDMDIHETYECTPITYFEQNKINIIKICANACGNCTFFISDKYELYGCGSDYNGENGLGAEDNYVYEPKLITQLGNDVIDAQSSGTFSVALCGSNSKQIALIIAFWCRLYQIPDDILKLLLLFTKSTSVYSTTFNTGSGHNPKRRHSETSRSCWNEIIFFKEKNINIIKIAISYNRSFFVDDTGKVWCCGVGRKYLGLGRDLDKFGEEDEIDDITEIEYFKEIGVKIVDIQCGFGHNIALDTEGNIYGWGQNRYGQCGFDTEDEENTDVDKPRRITFFDKFVVDEIKCGWKHNWVKTKCGRNYLFGSNSHYECLVFEDNPDMAMPHCIDGIVQSKCQIGKIIDVALGYFNTIIICCH